MILVEAAVESLEGALAAAEGGARRIELCEDLSSGGTTPEVQLLRECRSRIIVPIFTLVRPRPGNFVYSDDEHHSMLSQIRALKEAGARGIVTGALTLMQQIAEERVAELVKAAWPLPVTFHRAFDSCINLSEGLEVLVRLTVERVLTSGGARTALEGAARIGQLITQSEGRIEILAGGGITPDNVAELVRRTGVREVHFSAKSADKVRAVSRQLSAIRTDG